MTQPSCTCGPLGTDLCMAHLCSEQRPSCWTKLPLDGKGSQTYFLEELFSKLEDNFFSASGPTLTFKHLYGVDSPLNELYKKFFSKPHLLQQAVIPIFKTASVKIHSTRLGDHPSWKSIEAEAKRRRTDHGVDHDDLNESALNGNQPSGPAPSPPSFVHPPLDNHGEEPSPKRLKQDNNHGIDELRKKLELEEENKRKADDKIKQAELDKQRAIDEATLLKKKIAEQHVKADILTPLDSGSSAIVFIKRVITYTMEAMTENDRRAQRHDEIFFQRKIHNTLKEFKKLRRENELELYFDREYTTWKDEQFSERADFVLHLCEQKNQRVVIELKREKEDFFKRSLKKHIDQVQGHALNLLSEGFGCNTALLINLPLGESAGDPEIHILRGPNFDGNEVLPYRTQ